MFRGPLGSAIPLVIWNTNTLVRATIPYLSNDTMILILLLIFLDLITANELTAQPRIRTLVPFNNKTPVVLYAYIQPIVAHGLIQPVQHTYYARSETVRKDKVGDHSLVGSDLT
jgi:hypothetical protein